MTDTRKRPPRVLKKKAPAAKVTPHKRVGNTQTLEETAELIRDRRATAKALADEIKVLQDSALEQMDSLGKDEHKFTDQRGNLVKISRQQTHSEIIDEPRFKKRIGANMWNKVSTRYLDKKKLEAFIASQEIPAQSVAECSTTKTNNPFVKIT